MGRATSSPSIERTKSSRLGTYLARIGYQGELGPDAATLANLQRAHVTTIPFENLDIHLGVPIKVDLASIFAKLVESRRGGYCYEQNTLYGAALRALGFPVTLLAARVRREVAPGIVRPRTHLLLMVEADGERWISDVGYGGPGPLRPIPLVADSVVIEGGWENRLVREERSWVLQTSDAGEWSDLYTFTEDPQHPADVEMANYFTSTHLWSRFLHTPTAQLPGPQVRLMLRGRTFVEHRPKSVSSRQLDDDDELLDVLGSRFGLSFPPGTRFRLPPAAAAAAAAGAEIRPGLAETDDVGFLSQRGP